MSAPFGPAPRWQFPCQNLASAGDVWNAHHSSRYKPWYSHSAPPSSTHTSTPSPGETGLGGPGSATVRETSSTSITCSSTPRLAPLMKRTTTSWRREGSEWYEAEQLTIGHTSLHTTVLHSLMFIYSRVGREEEGEEAGGGFKAPRASRLHAGSPGPAHGAPRVELKPECAQKEGPGIRSSGSARHALLPGKRESMETNICVKLDTTKMSRTSSLRKRRPRPRSFPNPLSSKVSRMRLR
mmetsp:Transcript_35145/g.82758  ORF Transcript_35145/g.82758 Transcript_35145/m.82758 type:complete len:239 (-) Transcript_35145:4-720(-)